MTDPKPLHAATWRGAKIPVAEQRRETLHLYEIIRALSERVVALEEAHPETNE